MYNNIVMTNYFKCLIADCDKTRYANEKQCKWDLFYHAEKVKNAYEKGEQMATAKLDRAKDKSCKSNIQANYNKNIGYHNSKNHTQSITKIKRLQGYIRKKNIQNLQP